MIRISDIPNLLYEWLKVKFTLKMTLQLWDSWTLSIKRTNKKSPLLSFSHRKLIFYKCIFTILIKVMLQRVLESPFQKYDWFWLGNMTTRIPLQQAKVFQIPPLTIALINCTKRNKINVINWMNLAKSSPTETKCGIINKINRTLYIIWFLEDITNNSNKYCIFGLTFQSPIIK